MVMFSAFVAHAKTAEPVKAMYRGERGSVLT